MANYSLEQHWLESSADSFRVMNLLYQNKEYTNALFFGHLTLEKLLKSVYAKRNPDAPQAPLVHNLVKLAVKCDIELDNGKREQFGLINTFCIEARYDDVKKEFYKKCTHEFTTEQIKIIKELRTWLSEILTKNY